MGRRFDNKMFVYEYIHGIISIQKESEYNLNKFIAVNYNHRVFFFFESKMKVTSNPEDAYLGKMVGLDVRGTLKVNVSDPDIDRIKR